MQEFVTGCHVQLVLVLGDAQIPLLAADFPDLFKKMFIPGKFKQVILTGNMCTKKEVSFFESICPKVIVMNDYSEDDDNLPLIVRTEVAGYKICVCSGSLFLAGPTKEAVSTYANKEQADIVIYEKEDAIAIDRLNDVVCVSPGSVTGAYTPLKGNGIPSFICLSLLPDTINVFSYSLVDEKLSVNKEAFPRAQFELFVE